MEITSPNQIVVESSDRQDEIPVGGSDADVELDTDQFIITSREAPVAENPPLARTPDSMGNVEPIQTDSIIDPIVLGQLEEDNPLKRSFLFCQLVSWHWPLGHPIPNGCIVIV